MDKGNKDDNDANNKAKDGGTPSNNDAKAEQSGDKDAAKAGNERQSNDHEKDDAADREAQDPAAHDKPADLSAQIEESTNSEAIFGRKDQGDTFSLWWADTYYHGVYSNTNIILRYLIEIIIFSSVFLCIPLIGVIFSATNIKPADIFKPGGAEDNGWAFMLKINIFINLAYIADVLFFLVTEAFTSVAAYFLDVIGLYHSIFCWGVVQTIHAKRFYMRASLTCLFAFYLSTSMFGPYEMPQLDKDFDRSVMQTIILWLGIYAGLLFIVKFIVSLSTFEIKRTAYRDAIFELNYKTFVLSKLDRVAWVSAQNGSVDNVAEHYTRGYDDGLFMQQREFLQSREFAGDLAKLVFSRLDKKQITIEDIQRYFPDDYKEVYHYLTGAAADSASKRVLTQKQLKVLARELYEERRDMEKTLRDRDSIFDKLELIFSLIITYVAVIILMLLFQLNYKVFMASFGTSLITFSWIFADSIKNIYNCFIFLLIVRPYNVGDKVIVEDKTLFVERVDLFTTTFLSTFNQIVYIANSKLITLNIYNIARSPPQCESLDLTVDEGTTYKQAIELQDRAAERLNKKKMHFVECKLLKMAVGKLTYEIKHTKNFQNSVKLESRHSKIIRVFRKAIGEAGISYKESFEFSG